MPQHDLSLACHFADLPDPRVDRTKEHLLTDAEGGALSAVVAGANVPDCKLLRDTIEAIVVERPDPEAVEQHLCLDAGYDNPRGWQAVAMGGYIGHTRP